MPHLSGYGQGGNRLICNTFICEISHPRIRGATGSLWMVCYTTGNFLIIALGTFLTWRWALAPPTFMAVAAILGLLFLHESPIWLYRKGRYEACAKSLRFYDRSEKEAESEMGTIAESVKESEAAKRGSKGFVARVRSQWSDPAFYKTVIYACVTLPLLECCGIPFLNTYMVIFFKVT